jgi:SOS response regulatory protein OraA/RecX
MSSSNRRGNATTLLTAALRYARAGVRSTQELRTFLSRRGASSSQIESVVAACRTRGLLDDQASARLWAEHWARRGYAWAAIRVKLFAKGFDEPIIATAAGALATPEGGLRQRAQLARALGARGFDAELIEQVLAEAVGSTPADAER